MYRLPLTTGGARLQSPQHAPNFRISVFSKALSRPRRKNWNANPEGSGVLRTVRLGCKRSKLGLVVHIVNWKRNIKKQGVIASTVLLHPKRGSHALFTCRDELLQSNWGPELLCDFSSEGESDFVVISWQCLEQNEKEILTKVREPSWKWSNPNPDSCSYSVVSSWLTTAPIKSK